MQSFQKVRFIIAFLVMTVFFTQALFAQNNDDLKSELYSKLKCCVCQLSFDKCTCPEAKEMKAYIDALLESGMAKEEIFYKVARKFSLNTILDAQMKAKVEQKFIKEAGDKRPQIIVEPAYFNFGKLSKKQGKVSKIFKLYNKGNTTLIINNVRVSCGCVSASLKVGKNKSPYFGIDGARSGWQGLIAPAESGELEVVLDLTHESMGMGRQTREVFVSSNDPLYTQITVKVEVEVGD